MFNICMVISNFYPVVGGAERQSQNLALKLIAQGEKVFVLTRYQRNSPKYEVINGLPIYRLWSLTKSTRISSLIFNGHLFWSLIKFHKRYEVIHCHLLSTSTVVSIIIAKLLKKRVIVKLGGGGSSGDVWNIKNIALQGDLKLKYIKENIDWFVAPSQEIKQELMEAGVSEAKIKIIPNGVDLKNFYPISILDKKNLKLKMGFNEKKIIIYVGRMSPEKNVDILLETFKELHSQVNNWILLLVGEGPLKNKYLEWVQYHQLTKKIIFTGKVKDVCPYLQISDIFVLPSFFEGLPNALLEAMASGVSVVASATGGIKDLVKNEENGFLFASNDKGELKQKLERIFLLSSDIKEQIVKKAMQTVVEKYSLDLVVNQYKALYETLKVRRNGN